MSPTDVHAYAHVGTADKPRCQWRTRICTLHFKASLLIVFLLVLVASISSTLTNRATNLVFCENEYVRTLEWANSLAISTAEAVEAHDSNSLGRTVRDLIKTKGIAYVAFSTSSGEVLVSGESKAGLLQAALSPDRQTLSLRSMNDPNLVWHEDLQVACAEVTVPILSKETIRPSGTSARPIVGYLHLAADMTETKRQLERVSTHISRIALALVLLAVPASLLVTRHVVSPLKELARTARAIAKGSTDARAHIQSEDEIGELAWSFNTMADRLTESRMELLELNAELEDRVEQRTRELQELAARDPLTGLYNRRHFTEVIAREFAAAERYDADLTCLMFDLDHFKETNDLFGHRTGDDVLTIMAHTISTELRGSDVAARFGGDEFIVLLPQTSSASAAVLMERIASRFNEEVHRKFPEVPAGVSIGAASLRKTRAASAEALIHEADVALYACKEANRARDAGIASAKAATTT